MTEPSSWLAIERGWTVVASDGSEIGTVDEVVGDSGKDIFDGLTVSSGLLGKSRYLPAERVGSIVDGRVNTDLTPEEAEHLSPYEEPPPSEEISAEGASRWSRFRQWFGG